MADLTITETALGDGRIRYELGPAQLGGAADPGHPLTRRHRADRRLTG